jgi:hypothetical protein
MQSALSIRQGSVVATPRAASRCTAPRPTAAAQQQRRRPAPPAARGRSQGSVSDGLISVLKDELKVGQGPGPAS